MLSPYIGIAAELLVAALLIATTITCYNLGQKISVFKADETAMRSVIHELITASEAAERAIVGLRAALSESQRNLSKTLGEAEQSNIILAGQIVKVTGLIEHVETLSSNVEQTLQNGKFVATMLEKTIDDASHSIAAMDALQLTSPAAAPVISPVTTPVADTAQNAVHRETPTSSRHVTHEAPHIIHTSTAPQTLHGMQTLQGMDVHAIQRVLETSLNTHSVDSQPSDSAQLKNGSELSSAPEVRAVRSDERLAKAAMLAQGIVDRAMKRLEAQAA